MAVVGCRVFSWVCSAGVIAECWAAQEKKVITATKCIARHFRFFIRIMLLINRLRKILLSLNLFFVLSCAFVGLVANHINHEKLNGHEIHEKLRKILLSLNLFFVLFAPFCGHINLQFSIPACPD
jgi:hypothetical protein